MGAFYARAESYSRSYNAIEAEKEGRLPLTRAVAVVRSTTGVTAKIARQTLEQLHDGEWHHVGKYANRVNYYNTEAALDTLLPQRVIEREARAAMALMHADEAAAELEIEIAWEIRGKTLRAIATGLRAWTIVGKRFVVFAGPDETWAARHSRRWDTYNRELPVVEVFA